LGDQKLQLAKNIENVILILKYDHITNLWFDMIIALLSEFCTTGFHGSKSVKRVSILETDASKWPRSHFSMNNKHAIEPFSSTLFTNYPILQ
jgi:hypothetical protein